MCVRTYVRAYLFLYAHTYQYEFDVPVFRARKATHAGIAIETSQASQTSQTSQWLVWLIWLARFVNNEGEGSYECQFGGMVVEGMRTDQIDD
jgi:hypothetical protein